MKKSEIEPESVGKRETHYEYNYSIVQQQQQQQQHTKSTFSSSSLSVKSVLGLGGGSILLEVLMLLLPVAVGCMITCDFANEAPADRPLLLLVAVRDGAASMTGPCKFTMARCCICNDSAEFSNIAGTAVKILIFSVVSLIYAACSSLSTTCWNNESL